MSVKRQRIERRNGSGQVMMFHQGQRVEIEGWDEKSRSMDLIVMDNTRGFLYVLGSTDHSGLEMEQLSLVTMPAIGSVLRETAILDCFPPGILPLMAAYVGHVASRRWKSFVSLDKEEDSEWEKAEIDEPTGDMICSFTGVLTFLRVKPTGYMKCYRYEEDESFTAIYWSLVSSACMMADDVPAGPSGIYKSEWNDDNGTYIPRRIPNLPSVTISPVFSFVMDSYYIYTIVDNTIQRFLYDGSESEILYKSKDTISGRSLAWCGTRHLLFATNTREKKSDEVVTLVFVLSLSNLQTYCVSRVSRDIATIPTFNSCLLKNGSHSWIIIRFKNDLRLFPLPFSV